MNISRIYQEISGICTWDNWVYQDYQGILGISEISRISMYVRDMKDI